MTGEIHLIRHDDFELPGRIAGWAAARGRPVRDVLFFRGDSVAIPPAAEVETLLIMGGTMSANDDAGHPWLRMEKKWISDAIASGSKVLGICLGSQLLASILGGRVYRAKHREIGWFPVRRTEEARDTPFWSAIPEVHDAFLWHSDTFDIPPGALKFASGEGAENQGFTWRDSVVAVQFHPEMTLEGAEAIVANSAHEIVPGPYVQQPESFLAGHERYAALERVMYSLLDRLVEIE